MEGGGVVNIYEIFFGEVVGKLFEGVVLLESGKVKFEKKSVD